MENTTMLSPYEDALYVEPTTEPIAITTDSTKIESLETCDNLLCGLYDDILAHICAKLTLGDLLSLRRVNKYMKHKFDTRLRQQIVFPVALSFLSTSVIFKSGEPFDVEIKWFLKYFPKVKFITNGYFDKLNYDWLPVNNTLQITFENDAINYLEKFTSVPAMKFIRCVPDVSLITKVKKLELSNINPGPLNLDFTKLKYLQQLNLFKINEIDARLIAHIPDISITQVGINNFHAFGKQKRISIRNPYTGNTFDGMGNIRLPDWGKEYDVSCLRGVKTVNIANTKIINVTALGECENVSLHNISMDSGDFSAFGNVKSLMLDEMADLKDVRALGNVKKLSIIHCPNLTTIDGLGGNSYVSLIGLANITDVSCLANVDTVSIHYVPVMDYRPLKEVNKLDIQFCTLTYYYLEKSKELGRIENIPGLSDFPNMCSESNTINYRYMHFKGRRNKNNCGK